MCFEFSILFEKLPEFVGDPGSLDTRLARHIAPFTNADFRAVEDGAVAAVPNKRSQPRVTCSTFAIRYSPVRASLVFGNAAGASCAWCNNVVADRGAATVASKRLSKAIASSHHRRAMV